MFPGLCYHLNLTGCRREDGDALMLSIIPQILLTFSAKILDNKIRSQHPWAQSVQLLCWPNEIIYTDVSVGTQLFVLSLFYKCLHQLLGFVYYSTVSDCHGIDESQTNFCSLQLRHVGLMYSQVAAYPNSVFGVQLFPLETLISDK